MMIEGVSVAIMQYSMRMQQEMQEQMMKEQKKEIEKMMRRGGSDPWAVDFDPNLAGKDIQNDEETMRDSARSVTESTKSFSF